MALRIGAGLIVGAVALVVAGCGSSSPTAPSGSGGGGGSVTSGATITISATGVSPNAVTISVGQGVTFVNNDSRGHEIASNPHPTHTDCPAINALGSVGVGQTKITGALTTARACGFHDHGDPGNAAFQGTITIR